MKQRVLVPEQMDDPELDPDEHVRALNGLQRINSWTRNASLVWSQLLPIALEDRQRCLRVLDVATGAADIPISLLKRSAASGVKLEIDACDFSENALRFAAERCAAAKLAVRLFRHDVLHNEIPDQYDVVMCSQFLHHLPDADVVVALQSMQRAATKRVIVVDLERGYANWLQVWFATRVLSRSKVVHFDGPQSVRAAFTIDEISRLAHQVGFVSFEVQRKWPCRFVLNGVTDGAR
ncbi:MAG: methyltransferase domain-containing protein [Pirellulaceae bacterium]